MAADESAGAKPRWIEARENFYGIDLVPVGEGRWRVEGAFNEARFSHGQVLTDAQVRERITLGPAFEPREAL